MNDGWRQVLAVLDARESQLRELAALALTAEQRQQWEDRQAEVILLRRMLAPEVPGYTAAGHAEVLRLINDLSQEYDRRESVS